MEEFVDEQAEEVDSDMEDDDMPMLTEDSDDNADSDSDEHVLIFQKGPNEHMRRRQRLPVLVKYKNQLMYR